MASAAKIAYHLKQLRKLFARANDADFLQLIWAVDALQSDRIEAVSSFLTFPPVAADSDPNSSFAIHRWELETLLIQLLLTPKQPIRPGPNLILNCKIFDSMKEAINRLRSLENVESAFYLKGTGFNILDEMHRIAQRQFIGRAVILTCRNSIVTHLFTDKEAAPIFLNSSTVLR
jgi:hypothetical protein